MAAEGTRLRSILEIGEALRSLVLANDTSPVGAILYRIGNDQMLSDPEAPRVESTDGEYQRIMDQWMKEHLFRVRDDVIPRTEFIMWFKAAERDTFKKLGFVASEDKLRDNGFRLTKMDERLEVAYKRYGRVLPKILFQVGNEEMLRTPGLPRVESKSRYQEVMDEYMKAHLFTAERKKITKDKFEEFFLAAERTAWRELLNLRIDPTPETLEANGFTLLEKKERLAIAENVMGDLSKSQSPSRVFLPRKSL